MDETQSSHKEDIIRQKEEAQAQNVQKIDISQITQPTYTTDVINGIIGSPKTDEYLNITVNTNPMPIVFNQPANPEKEQIIVRSDNEIPTNEINMQTEAMQRSSVIKSTILS